MPIMKCRKKGKSGYKFGKKGFCYTSKNAKEKAKKQGRAIKRSQMLRINKKNKTPKRKPAKRWRI